MKKQRTVKNMLFRDTSPLAEETGHESNFFFLNIFKENTSILLKRVMLFFCLFVFLIHAWLLTDLGTFQNTFDKGTK